MVLVGAMCPTFAGLNLWRPYSDWGQPFDNHLRADLSPEDNALLVPNIGSMTVDRGVLVLAYLGAVSILLTAFVYAPLRQYPAWSVAENNLRAATGNTCGLQPEVQVLLPTGLQPDATGPPLLSGDFAFAEGMQPPTPSPDGTAVWHTAGSSSPASRCPRDRPRSAS